MEYSGLRRLFILFLLWAVAVTVSGQNSGNLVYNPGFELEAPDGFPLGWWAEQWDQTSGATTYQVVAEGAYAGDKCFLLTNHQPNDARIMQEIKVEPDTIYRIGCRVRAEGLTAATGGANLSILNHNYSSAEYFNTNGWWELVEFYVRTPKPGPSVLRLALRLGGWGALNTGKAYFDEVVVEAVPKPPIGALVIELESEKQAAEEQTPAEGVASAGPPHRDDRAGKRYLVLFSLVVTAFLVWAEKRWAKR
ncbi:hypothetical protein G5B42_07465 [Hydrogenispora sp. UU3]|uniref:Carbohydrate binding domain-containing protein n=1 Tax=Capillibacterium thermochitinicola TaxID=2699427 RepID=A0A8J6LJ37_9FIRM|nr:hypothetical protein [Capillibacterium thermochitinicola]